MLCEHATASGRCYRYYARRNGGVESRYSIQTLAHPQTTETKEKKKILRGFFSRIRKKGLTLPGFSDLLEPQANQLYIAWMELLQRFGLALLVGHRN
jgi:hypothetical protein